MIGTKTKSLLIASLLAFGFIHQGGRAYPYRPFGTEDAGVAGKRVAQLELSWDYLKWKGGDQESVLLLVPIYGVTSWCELSLEIPWMLHNPKQETNHAGIGDINLVSKFLVLKEGKKNPAMILKGVVKTDSGNANRSLGSGDFDYSLVTAASKELGPVVLHAMFGYTFVGDNGDSNVHNIFLYGLALDYAVTQKFHLGVELNGKTHPDRNINVHPIEGLVGATYKLSEFVTFDAATRFGFSDSVPQVSTTLGASFTF